MGFFIWAEDENLESIQNKRNRTYFIPQDDFAYVIKIFGGVSKSMLKKSRLDFDKIEKCE